MEAKDRIEELRKKINYYSELYYDEDNSPITDYDYDIMMNELKKLERENPDILATLIPNASIARFVYDNGKWILEELPK